MQEEARSIGDIAPEVSEETDEVATDAFIDELLLHTDASEAVLRQLESASGPCRERLEKLHDVREDMHAFLTAVDDTFPEGQAQRKRIREALALMLKLHINQADRVATGRPFVSHPLAVAQRTLEAYAPADVGGEPRAEASFAVVGALLHDSIEDQARLLKLEKRLIRARGTERAFAVTLEQLDREGALHGIGHIFGLRTQLLVQSVTSPEELKTDIPQERKNEIYKRHVQEIFHGDAITSGSAVIKWSDLQENALTLNELLERAQALRESGNEKEAEEAHALYEKLREKYRPVLVSVRSFFVGLTDERHPLYAQREDAVQRIDDALRTQYADS